MKSKILGLLAVSLLAGPMAANAIYAPVGVQQNVAIATVLGGGWTQCYQATMGVIIGSNAEAVTTPCQGDNLMMAGRRTGSDTLLVLAWGDRDDVLFNVGNGADAHHVVNGAEWYFSPDWSWGFAGLGDTTNRFECDTAGAGETDRMCLHTLNYTGGWRIGSFLGLNDSVDFEKIFFVQNVPEPGTLALLGLGLVGLGLSRRRKAA